MSWRIGVDIGSQDRGSYLMQIEFDRLSAFYRKAAENGWAAIHYADRPRPKGTSAVIVQGDLLDQPVEAIVNAWNRNIIPWWLLLPQGVSGAIKRRAGYAPFWELGRLMPNANVMLK